MDSRLKNKYSAAGMWRTKLLRGFTKTKLLLFASVILGAASTTAILTRFCEDYYYRVDDARVQMVIIDKTPIPRFAFVLSSLPLAISSHLKYGKPAFSLASANLEPTLSAFAKSEFLILGAHGRDGHVKLDDGAWVGPKSVPKNDNLRLVYFGSCEFGAKRSQWQERFPFTDLVGYDGLTTPLHGWIYLVFSAPFRLWA